MKSIFKTVQVHQSSFTSIKRTLFKSKGLYIIGCITFLMVAFQNCTSDTVSTNSRGPQPELPGELPGEPPGTTSSLSYENGQIIAYLPSEGESMPKDRFDINADVHLKMRHVHPDADNFKWTITRGFDSIVNSKTINQNEYQHRFTQTGSHILFATAHQGSSSDLLTQSIKRIVVGAECHLENILEMQLQSGSFTSDSSATLTLRDASDFTDITWKVILPSGQSDQSERIFNGATLTIDLTGEQSGALIIEVSAVDSDGCLVYRKKELQVTENLQAYINPFQITDDGQEIAVTLENNNIYKYRRPRGSIQILNLDIKNADRCEFQLNNRKRSVINCQGAIDISLSSNTECQRTLVKFWISSGDQVDSSYQYYNYCPANDGLCYFGSLKESMGQHFCSESIALASESDHRPGLVSDRSIDGQCNNARRNGCLTGNADDGAIADTEDFYRWHCVGVNNGETATNCHKRIPINGQCDNSKRNSCLAGQVNDEVLEDTVEFYKWHCEGEHGGTTATDCQKNALSAVVIQPSPIPSPSIAQSQSLQPVNGQCDNSSRNGCQAGTVNAGAVADTDTHYKWRCDGQHGGRNSGTCQKSKPCPAHHQRVNNQCLPSCGHKGGPDAVSGNACSDTENYEITIISGVYDVSLCCTRTRKINGQCDNSRRNGCRAGTANAGAVADTSTLYKWRCDGQHGGRNSGTCQIRIPINGQCDNSRRNGCQAGTANAGAVADTSTLYKWRCDGQHGGRNSGTCQIRIPINGQCDNSRRNGCRAGTANAGAVADTSTHYKWRCDGQHGGRNSGTCQKSKPCPAHHQRVNNQCLPSCGHKGGPDAVSGNACSDTENYEITIISGVYDGPCCTRTRKVNGQCDNSRRNGCQAGTANDEAVADTNTLYKWHCEGEHGGTTATDCQKTAPSAVVIHPSPIPSPSIARSQLLQPVNGQCDNSRRNGCQAGTANDNAVADTGTLYKWRCDGQHGGQNSGTCQKNKPPAPVNGQCDNSRRNRCRTGTANDNAVADTGTLYKWRCDGQHGGRNSGTCQKNKPPAPVNGQCNNNQRNGCRAGSATSASVSGNYDVWYCTGQNGGSRSGRCSKLRPINGQCDNNRRNGCRAGSATSASVSGNYDVWYCTGQNGGSRSGQCRKPRPINGRCNNNSRYRCHEGRPTSTGTSGDNYVWYCTGQNGGSRSGRCSKPRPIAGRV